MPFTFTKGTREILTSFSKINSGIVLDPLAETHIVGQNAIRTISSDGDDAIFAVATVPEVFDQSVVIPNISDFVKALDQYDSPTVQFVSDPVGLDTPANKAELSEAGASSAIQFAGQSDVVIADGANPTITSNVVATLTQSDILKITTEIAKVKSNVSASFTSTSQTYYDNLGESGLDYSSVPSTPSTAEAQQNFIGNATEIASFQSGTSSAIQSVNDSNTAPTQSDIDYEVAFEITVSPLSLKVYVTKDRIKSSQGLDFSLPLTISSSNLTEDTTLYIPVSSFEVLLSGLDYTAVLSTVDEKIQFYANHVGSQLLSDVNITTPNTLSSLSGNFTDPYKANRYIELVSDPVDDLDNDGYYRIAELGQSNDGSAGVADTILTAATKPFVSTESEVEYTVRIPVGYFYYENTYDQDSFDTALSTYQSAQDTYNAAVEQYETDFEAYSEQKSLDIRANDELLLDAKLAIRDDKLIASPAGGGSTNYTAPTAQDLTDKLATSPYDQYSATYEQDYDATGNGNPSGSNPRPVEPEFTESAPIAGGNEVTFSSSLSYWLPATVVTGLIPTS